MAGNLKRKSMEATPEETLTDAGNRWFRKANAFSIIAKEPPVDKGAKNKGDSFDGTEGSHSGIHDDPNIHISKDDHKSPEFQTQIQPRLKPPKHKHRPWSWGDIALVIIFLEIAVVIAALAGPITQKIQANYDGEAMLHWMVCFIDTAIGGTLDIIADAILPRSMQILEEETHRNSAYHKWGYYGLTFKKCKEDLKIAIHGYLKAKQ